jgi:hypothetical protein
MATRSLPMSPTLSPCVDGEERRLRVSHPDPGTLERFARGTASRGEAMEVVAHLLRQCPVCAAILSCSIQPILDPDVYAPVFDRVIKSRCGRKEAKSA